ncbi:MAG TPA: VOC family protein [Gemmatimonadaceae bacterium]|nr:VOC family protein [Gemmatimonadaceae bacterium]
MADLGGARVGQVAIICQDVSRATAFYRDTLGVRFLFSAGPKLAFFDAGGTRLMLTEPEGDATGSSMLYFFVKDIHAVQGSLAAKGVQFLGEPHIIAKMPDHDLWLTALRDSEGSLIGIMEERRG